jgi:hypothetical protein
MRSIASILLLTAFMLIVLTLGADFALANVESTFGKIETPPGVELYQAEVGGDDIAIILFISRMIQIATIVAGIWVVFNVFLAAYQYFASNGEASAHVKVKDALTMSVLGLGLIIASYTIAGIIGLLLFNDAGFILNPTL